MSYNRGMAIDYDIAVVGGGASGLAASIAAAETAQQAGLHVDVGILEADERVGRSILVTGNGRCNFSNERIQPVLYRNAGFVQQALASLGDEDAVVDFFEGWGLEWRMDAEGRYYPLANKASVVLDVLRYAAAHLGVREACGLGVQSIRTPQHPDAHFTMHMADGSLVRARRVIVACGGKAAAHIDVEGLDALATTPVLGPIRCAADDRAFTHELDNVRVRCSIMLMHPEDDTENAYCTGSENGELLFRPYGVSGICIFNLSRLAQPGDYLNINFLQTSGFERAVGFLERRCDQLAKHYGQSLDYAAMLRGLVLPRVADALLKRAGKRGSDAFAAQDVEDLAEMLCSCSLWIEGIGDPSVCQVQRGGFACTAFDPRTMQSRALPGLFAAGEALDVDGPCGGYNLHWAWGSGLLAGRSAAHSLASGEVDAR